MNACTGKLTSSFGCNPSNARTFSLPLVAPFHRLLPLGLLIPTCLLLPLLVPALRFSTLLLPPLTPPSPRQPCFLQLPATFWCPSPSTPRIPLPMVAPLLIRMLPLCLLFTSYLLLPSLVLAPLLFALLHPSLSPPSPQRPCFLQLPTIMAIDQL